MGGVAGEEDAAAGVAVGYPFGGAPGRLSGDFHVEVGDAHGLADVALEAFLGERVEGFAALGMPGCVEDPVFLVVDGEQGAVGVGVGEVAADEAAVADDLGQPC